MGLFIVVIQSLFQYCILDEIKEIICLLRLWIFESREVMCRPDVGYQLMRLVGGDLTWDMSITCIWEENEYL